MNAKIILKKKKKIKKNDTRIINKHFIDTLRVSNAIIVFLLLLLLL